MGESTDWDDINRRLAEKRERKVNYEAMVAAELENMKTAREHVEEHLKGHSITMDIECLTSDDTQWSSVNFILERDDGFSFPVSLNIRLRGDGEIHQSFTGVKGELPCLLQLGQRTVFDWIAILTQLVKANL